MRLVTVRQDMTVMYREERIPLFPAAADEYFEEICEHVGQGLHVELVYPDDYWDGLEWD